MKYWGKLVKSLSHWTLFLFVPFVPKSCALTGFSLPEEQSTLKGRQVKSKHIGLKHLDKYIIQRSQARCAIIRKSVNRLQNKHRHAADIIQCPQLHPFGRT